MFSTNLITNTYKSNNGLLDYSIYGNGNKVGYTYDNYDRMIEKKYNDVVKFKYTYDNLGNIFKREDLINNITYKYNYDFIGRPSYISGTNGHSMKYTYDTKNRLSSFTNIFSGFSNKISYIYGNVGYNEKPGLIYGLKINDTQRVAYSYDELARLKTRTLNLNTNYNTNYSYLVGGSSNSTTTLLSSIQNGSNALISYTYDNKGNISTISEGGVLKATYTYDNLNQLTREDNLYINKSIKYTYDAGGNITSKVEYVYTIGALGTPTRTYDYDYDSTWKDKLTSYDGKAFTYDAIGNPTDYDGKRYKWENGRQLSQIYNNGGTVGVESDDTLLYSYKYDDSGIRTQKTVNGVTTNYYLNGSNIVRQTDGTNTLDFFYDDNSNLIGFQYNSAMYYYIRNGQNDIIGILDSSGNQVVNYVYDSWGKLEAVTGSNTALGNLNPFRYRGYYYDVETGLYSLQSRYYDPEIGRFINADSQLNDDILGNNLFAYCGNNPVTRTDDSGQGWWIAAGAIIGGLVGGITRAVSNVATGKKWNDGIIGAIAGGAVYGGVLAATGNVVAAGFAGAATESVINEVASYTPVVSKMNGRSSAKKVTKRNVVNSVKTVAKDTAINGTISAVTGKIAGKIVPTNSGWFQPQKFVSSFIGKYAVKSELQSLTQGGLLFGYEGLKYSVGQRMQGQQPTVTFFPDTEIRAAG